MRNILVLIGLTAGISFSMVSRAQTAASAPTATAVPEVSLDLLVHDRKGRPVTDLKPGDLAITDGGKSIKIGQLHLANKSLASDRLVAFVFGQLDSAASKSAQITALKILKMLPEGQCSIAIMGVDGRLRLLQRYTTDRSAVTRAIDVLTTATPADWHTASSSNETELIALSRSAPHPAEEAQAKMLLSALQQSQQLVLDKHAEPEIAGLTAISKAQRQAPGRKAILYFARSAQTDVNTLDQLHEAAAAANAASTSIYPIDLNALDYAANQQMLASLTMGSMASANNQNHVAPLSGPPSGFQSLMGPGGMTEMKDTINNLEADNAKAGSGPLGELAASTGGLDIGVHDNYKKAVQLLVNDLTAYYVASYPSPIEIYDGSFRQVKVKPLRSGLFVSTPPGYLALPHDEDSAQTSLDASLLNVFKNPEAAKDVEFRAATLHFGETPDGTLNEIAVEVPTADLEIRQDPNTDLYSMHIAVAARVEDSKGKIIQEFSEDIRRHGGLHSLDAFKATAVTFQRPVSLPPGDYVLKTAVVDSNSEKAGAQSVSFHVAPQSVKASLSDIVLVRRTDTPLSDSAPGSADPLRYNGGEVVPDLSGTLPAAKKDITVFFTAHPVQGEPAEVSVSIARSGKQVGRWPLHAIKETKKASFPYMSTLNAKSLPAGSYEITVDMIQGSTKTERKLAFVKDGTDSEPDNTDMQTTAAMQDQTELESASLKKNNAPSAEQATELIESARKRALGYSDKLPNFLCVEVIDRSVDHSGKGRWTHRDNIAELLRYRDSAESRVVLEVNGVRSNMEQNKIKGAQSNGEFGGLLKSIFDPEAAASFQWEGERELSTGPVQVFRYMVAQKNSKFGLVDNSRWSIDVAFHGLVSIEPATGAVRSVTVEAQDMPTNFDIHASAIHVDYDYIAINNHDYLLPVRGQVTLRQGRHEAVLNTLQFRDYKRFSSRSRILPASPAASTN